VIIPALNEEHSIAAAIDSAGNSGAAEVIVCDGGSSDRTVEIARARGAAVVASETMRARQMNRGADTATGDVLIFLHADTALPPDGARLAARAIEGGAEFGGFRVRFAEDEPRLRVAAAMINLRTRISRAPWGDQAQFIPRSLFFELGAFREIPLMEDYELAVRMRRRGRSVVLPEKVITSGRRFLDRGVFPTAFTNWKVIVMYRLGTDPARLEQVYRR
jgi:rSAM/selenodomain-associated transferase 2